MKKFKLILFFLLLVASCLPQVNSGVSLALGIAFSLMLGNPFVSQSAVWSKRLLQISVVGLGFGVGIGRVLQEGQASIPPTLIGIVLVLVVGGILGKLLRVGANTSLLISFGTAICGGSAIAALAPVIRAKQAEIAVALATVFTLNAVALYLFPLIGQALEMSGPAFGLWAALAIHDTSSVVGAASIYGQEAMATALTVKLTRALWIVPVVLLFGLTRKVDQKIKVPFFILGFLLASCARSFLPQFSELWDSAAQVSRQLLVVTLFLIGLGLSRETLREVGLNPLLHAVVLWFVVGGVYLLAVVSGVLQL